MTTSTITQDRDTSTVATIKSSVRTVIAVSEWRSLIARLTAAIEAETDDGMRASLERQRLDALAAKDHAWMVANR